MDDRTTMHQDHINKINAFIIAEDDPIEKAKLMFWLSMVNEQSHIAEMCVSVHGAHNRRFTDVEGRVKVVEEGVRSHESLVIKTDMLRIIIIMTLPTILGLIGIISWKAYDLVDVLRQNQVALMVKVDTLIDHDKKNWGGKEYNSKLEELSEDVDHIKKLKAIKASK